MNKAIVGGFAIVLVGITGWHFWSNETWILMVCKEKLNAAQCASISRVIGEFETQRECMLEGSSKFSREGFECGRGCTKTDGLPTCKKICNLNGCSE